MISLKLVGEFKYMDDLRFYINCVHLLVCVCVCDHSHNAWIE